MKVNKVSTEDPDLFKCTLLPENTQKDDFKRTDLAFCISIKVISSGKDKEVHSGTFRIDIREKLVDQLEPLLRGSFGQSGGLVRNGKLIGADDSAHSINLRADEILNLAGGAAGGRIKPDGTWYRSYNI